MFKILLLTALLTPLFSFIPPTVPPTKEPCILAAPASISASWSGNQIRATWSAVTNADAYFIRIENKDTHAIIIEDITGGQYTGYQTSGMDNSANYRVSVRSMCGTSCSDYVIIIDVTGV